MSQKRFHTLNQNFITITIVAYTLLIVVWLLLRIIFFDTYWPIAIVNTTAVYCFLPLPILLLATLFISKKRVAAGLFIPLIAFLIFWGALFLPQSASITERSQPTIKIMSFNILGSNKSTAELIHAVTADTPDIVGFQELSPTSINAFKSEFQNSHPYHTFDIFEPRGVGLMSRFPITAVHKIPFPPYELALHAIIDWEGQPVHIFVVHLSANNFFDNSLSQLPQLATERYGQRAYQITRLHEELAAIEAPILLLCDCNLTDTSKAYARMNSILIDSYKIAGWGLGHTLHPPGVPFRVQRIDYIWHSQEFVSTDSYVGLNGNSDHHPVIFTLMFTQFPHTSEENP
ncbi:MAG: hypothetical protein GY796_01820 [Chloroflexi bacterium]|nr:hypothetical protein [Chloroflexota bacterium]